MTQNQQGRSWQGFTYLVLKRRDVAIHHVHLHACTHGWGERRWTVGLLNTSHISIVYLGEVHTTIRHLDFKQSKLSRITQHAFKLLTLRRLIVLCTHPYRISVPTQNVSILCFKCVAIALSCAKICRMRILTRFSWRISNPCYGCQWCAVAPAVCRAAHVCVPCVNLAEDGTGLKRSRTYTYIVCSVLRVGTSFV